MTTVGMRNTSTEREARDRWLRLGLRLAGAGLLTAVGAIHLDLYLTGFRHIPTIGWLLLLQVLAAFGLAAGIAVPGSRLVAAAGGPVALSPPGASPLAGGVGLVGSPQRPTPAAVRTRV